jgi:hypothetical protein
MMCANGLREHLLREGRQLRLIQQAIGADAAADVEREGLDPLDGGSRVFRVESAGKVNRYGDCLKDLAAYRPVVYAPGAAKLFNFCT